MRNLLWIVMNGLLLSVSQVSAASQPQTVFPYTCTNKSGKLGHGTGRLSVNNEYSTFLKKPVRAGEYVVFRYEGEGEEYWFKANRCSRAGSK